MQPVTGNNSSGVNKCKETSSKCVVWDGPDIDCLGVTLCKGQSIEVIVYNTAKQLCDLLDMLNITNADLQCLGTIVDPDNPNVSVPVEPKDVIDLINIIITKLCQLNEIVIDLQNPGTTNIYVDLLNCADPAIIANCPAGTTTQYTDVNGNTVTQLLLIGPDGQTSPAVQYLVTLICDLLCRMGNAEIEIADLRADVDNLMNQAAGALPPVYMPSCIDGTAGDKQIVDPDDSTKGALPDMAILLCDIKEELVNGNPVSTLTSYALDPNVAIDCNTTIAAATPLGVYPSMSPPPLDLGDLGAINNPQTLQEVITNLWVAVCDLRNFAAIVKANCCPPYCNSVIWDMDAGTTTLNRDTVRVILNGSFTDFFGAPITAASSIPPPGFDPAGPPSFYGGNFPYTITISDQSGNTVSPPPYTPIENLFTSGNFIDVSTLAGVPNPLNNLDNYDVTLTAYVVAPDFSVCNQVLTKTIAAICDNKPFTSLTILDYGFDGATINYALPLSPPWPAGGTIPETIEIEIIDITNGNQLVDSGSIDYGVYPGYEIYIYSDPDNILPNPGSCSGGCLNFFQTDSIQPNVTYQIRMRIVYNCGASAWTVTPSFTTFVPIEITLKGSAADVCTLGGSLQLVADGALPTDISANFETTIDFDPAADTIVTVFAKAGTTFGYILYTPYIVDTSISIQGCPVQLGVQCWGPPSLYKYQTGGIGGLQFSGTTTQYDRAGCYDYINCQIIGDFTTLSYTGITSLDNIDNVGAPENKPGNFTNLEDNSPAPGYDSLVIPALFNPNINPVPIKITVDPILHPMNGGAVPRLYLSILPPSNPLDPNYNEFFTDQGLIYFPAPQTNQKFGGGSAPSGVPITVYYNNRTKAWMGPAYVGGLPATSWTSVYTTNNPATPIGQPIGVPAFMRISLYRWGGASWNLLPDSIYYVTSDWLNAGTLTNINNATGFLMSNIGLQLRDKVQIEWSAGVQNNNLNPDYIGISAPGAIDPMYGKVTIEQDQYPGILSSFVADGPRGGESNSTFTGATAATPLYGAGCLLYGDPLSVVGAVSNNNRIEFVVTGDTHITWNVSYSVPV